MTTHDMHSTDARSTAATEVGPNLESEQPPGADQPLIEDQPSLQTVPPTDADEPSDDQLLFADDDLSGLQARWDDVQASFVDDPTESVQKADALVAQVVEQLTSRFAGTRSGLEAQWARGQEASTEELRLALRRYREFFERLLTV